MADDAAAPSRLLRVVGALAAAGALVCLGGLLLPGDWEVSRSAVIEAEPETVFPLVNTFEGWVAWGEWATEIDPDLEFLPGEGEAAGEGMTLQWYSGGEPQGQLTITESQPPELVAYDMIHGVPGEGMLVHGTMALEEVEGGTQVTWTESGQIPLNPLYRYMAFFTADMIGEDFEMGLASLKAEAERRAALPEPAAPADGAGLGGGGPSYEGH